MKAAREAQLVVNATPLGLHAGDASVLPSEAFHDGHFVFDLIYMTSQTVFTKAAAEAGAKTANGLGMLLHQARPAFAAWFGADPAVTQELRDHVLAAGG